MLLWCAIGEVRSSWATLSTGGWRLHIAVLEGVVDRRCAAMLLVGGVHRPTGDERYGCDRGGRSVRRAVTLAGEIRRAGRPREDGVGGGRRGHGPTFSRFRAPRTGRRCRKFTTSGGLTCLRRSLAARQVPRGSASRVPSYRGLLTVADRSTRSMAAGAVRPRRTPAPVPNVAIEISAAALALARRDALSSRRVAPPAQRAETRSSRTVCSRLAPSRSTVWRILLKSILLRSSFRTPRSHIEWK